MGITFTVELYQIRKWACRVLGLPGACKANPREGSFDVMRKRMPE